MKRMLFITLSGVLAAVRTFGQGQFAFRNILPGRIDAPVFDRDCETRLSGKSYLSQVYAGLTPENLQPLSAIVPFSPAGPLGGGYMNQVLSVTVPGAIDPGQIVYAQLHAWEAAAGSTYEAAVENQGKFGFSNIVPVRAYTPPSDSDWPVGLQSFCLLPEPSTLTLFFSAAALVIVSASLHRQRDQE